MSAKTADSQSKKKKVKNQTGTAQAVSTDSPSPKTKKSKGFALPSQAEIMKNPMKYISVAVKQFQSLGEQVEKQGEAIVQIAKHIQDSDEKLAPLVNAIEQAKAAREQTPQGPNPIPQGMGGMGALMQFLPALLGGGGGMSDTDKWLREVGRDTIGLSNLMYKAMIQEMVPGVLEKWSKRRKEIGKEP